MSASIESINSASLKEVASLINLAEKSVRKIGPFTKESLEVLTHKVILAVGRERLRSPFSFTHQEYPIFAYYAEYPSFSDKFILIRQWITGEAPPSFNAEYKLKSETLTVSYNLSEADEKKIDVDLSVNLESINESLSPFSLKLDLTEQDNQKSWLLFLEAMVSRGFTQLPRNL